MSASLALSAGLFVTWSGQVARLGHVDRPADLWEVSADVAALVLGFGGGRDLGLVLRMVPASARSAFTSAVDEFRTHGLLVNVTAAPDAADMSDNPRTVEFELTRHLPLYRDIDSTSPGFRTLYDRASAYTLTGIPLAYALYQAVQYIVGAGIPGAVVECGVWRGGSMLLAAEALAEAGDLGRDLWLYDTFDWLWEPAGDKDGYVTDSVEHKRLRQATRDMGLDLGSPEKGAETDGVGVDDVRKLLTGIGWRPERLRLVPGLVQKTLPSQAPDEIALLRLDTDFYESTRHELECLYPRLRPGGVLIIDDYGKHEGATQAVDEYFAASGLAPLLTRVDIQGRICVKPDQAVV